MFVSCFFSSWIFGGFLTYLEGRQNTETLLAVLAAFYICAGNLSRGTAKFVVTLGVPGLWMPLAIGRVRPLQHLCVRSHSRPYPHPPPTPLSKIMMMMMMMMTTTMMMAWRGVAWRGVALCGAAWRGVVRCGTKWNGMESPLPLPVPALSLLLSLSLLPCPSPSSSLTPLPPRTYPPSPDSGVVALPISLVFLVLADRSPGPSPEDIAMRSKRKAMSLQEQRVFAWTWMAGLVLMLLAYTLLTTVRSFRDFYSQQIFKSSLRIPSDRDVPSYVFFLVDLPGGVLSCLVVALFKRIVDNRRGLLACIIVITASAVLAVGSTIGFRNGILRGMTFQVLLGVGIYVAYSVIGSPLNERWLAATKTEGTLSFLVFTSDFCGYVGTIVLLLYRSFGPMSGSADADVLALFLTVEWWCMAAVAMAMAGLLTYFMWRLPKYDTRMPVPDQTTAEQSPPGA